jgi:hypothetical protein
MKINKQKEEIFYSKPFSFSYSSLNRLIFSPSLFYKDYILKDREIKTDKHLIEGKLVHCLVFQPKELYELFSLVPGKVPSENIKKTLKNILLHTDAVKLPQVEDFIILDSLKELNLYQSLKEDKSRIAKVRTSDHENYFEFLQSTGKDIIDNDTLQKCKDKADIIKNNDKVMELFNQGVTDFELDTLEVFAEKLLECKLQNYDFGLKGIVDYYTIDHDKKELHIIDLKTTSRTLSDFTESIDFYNYWLQAAIYTTLVLNNHSKTKSENYKILFTFVVIDNYNQVYPFSVSDNTMDAWAKGMSGILDRASFHYKENNYSLPYEFLNNNVKL